MADTIPSPHDKISVTKRTLQFFWLADWSGSMSGQKIASLNAAIHEAVELVQNTVKSQPSAAAVEVKMRAIRFADKAEWHVGPDPVSLEQFRWPDLGTDGYTATSQALKLLIEELSLEKMPRRGLPPVAILISDGFCTDAEGEYEKMIEQLNSIPWGKKCIRMAIAIGNEAEYDEIELAKFSNPKDIPLLKAKTPEQLIGYIRWASTMAVTQSSKSKTSNSRDESFIGDIGPVPVIDDSADVF